MKGTDTSIIAFFQATLVWHLYGLSTDHLEEPLAAFGMSLPSGFVACILLSAFPCNIGHSLLCPRWGLPLAWALSALPLTPLLLGAVLQLAWIRRGVPFTMVPDCYETFL